MTDDMRFVPIDDDLVEDDVVLDEVVIVDADLAVKPHTPTPRVASSAESRDWDEQGFDANRYDERPPHWEA
jgi:hypothetical protein